MIGRALCALFLFPGLAWAAGPEDVDCVTAASLPLAVVEAFAGLDRYAFEARINLLYLHADFDGDGKADTAILLKEKATGRSGYGVLLGGSGIHIVGAGTPIGDAGADFSGMNAWLIQGRGVVLQGATGEPPPILKGDALLAIKTESASGLVYWDGMGFRWYQWGD